MKEQKKNGFTASHPWSGQLIQSLKESEVWHYFGECYVGYSQMGNEMLKPDDFDSGFDIFEL